MATPYFDASRVFDHEVKTVDQPKVRARFSKEVRLSAASGEVAQVGAEYEVPLDVAHAFAHCILPEEVKPKLKLVKPVPKKSSKK